MACLLMVSQAHTRWAAPPTAICADVACDRCLRRRDLVSMTAARSSPPSLAAASSTAASSTAAPLPPSPLLRPPPPHSSHRTLGPRHATGWAVVLRRRWPADARFGRAAGPADRRARQIVPPGPVISYIKKLLNYCCIAVPKQLQFWHEPTSQGTKRRRVRPPGGGRPTCRYHSFHTGHLPRR